MPRVAIQVGPALWDWARPYVLGILNVTPDSFSDGGRFDAVDAALARAEAMISEGADAIDVGGESTRPGAEPIETAEEIRRVVPAVEALVAMRRVPVSIDTTKAAVARAALAAGASIVNDVAMGNDPAALAEAAREYDAVYIAMHARGTPSTMHAHARYDDVVTDVRDELRAARDRLAEAGVAPERIVLDPGIGFAKTGAQSLALLRNLDALASLGMPLCVGPSRKRFIVSPEAHPPGWATDSAGPLAREGGTAAAVAISVFLGADMVRVHDVALHAQTARVAHALRLAKEGGRAG